MKKWTDELVQIRANITMYASSASTKMDLAEKIRDRAGKLFAEGRDEIAMYLRNTLVPELLWEAKKDRERQAKQEDKFDKLRYENDG